MIFIKKKRTSPSSFAKSAENNRSNDSRALNANLNKNIQTIKETLGNSSDLIIREICIGETARIQAAVLYMDGLADSKSVNHFILELLMLDIQKPESEQTIDDRQTTLQLLKNSALAVGEIKDVADFETIYTAILSGDVVIVLDGYTQCFAVGMKGFETRSVEEPASTTVVRGSREGFTENIRTNTTLIRRRIKDPNLWLEGRQIGRVTKTFTAIMYIKGIANDKIVEEVRQRLDRIEIDGILESGYIEELIQDETYSPFPTIYNSERPDVIAAGLLEGRIAILVDGTPFVLLVPALFAQYFQSAEDYYHRADFGIIRILRYLALFIALLGPSLYIAITTFHQEMLPTTLLVSIASQREGVPFPAFIEALMMEATFEILREAGVRMPRAVGQAVSIVGALVIGEAAVQAGVVSAVMVIVVSITAIANFSFPAFDMAISIRILRFAMMSLAASFGLFGITVGLIAMVLHLCSLRSFGVPYMSPFAPFIPDDQKDAIFRVPWWGLFSRPRLINQKNVQREQNPPSNKPEPE
ncbi:spore germination protein [Fodinisporobacter ferrooxydans]|uniref:Spore germination protein n=1 Tax=Fodinisporobacter ferrooxydans TaxID=2901836 RepID=A0ABY4CEP3_9BACL|nr:spore germination protein [Alicyclobacillaceae bacterium MYW30-H2]